MFFIEIQEKRFYYFEGAVLVFQEPDLLKLIQCGSGSKKYFCRDLGVRWEAACVQHVDVAVQIVEKLDQLIKKFYTGSKLESNSIFIQYLLAKVTYIFERW